MWFSSNTSKQLAKIITMLKEIQVSQADIGNAVTTFTNLLTDVQNDTAAILTDLTTLAQGGGTIDTSQLNAIVAKVSAVDSALGDAVGQLNTLATPPTTPPAV